MAKTISDDEFYNTLEGILKDSTRSDLIMLIFEYCFEEVADNYNNEIISEWENEQIEDVDTYEALVAEFKEFVEPAVTSLYGADDFIAKAEEWNNWTDMLCKEDRLTEGQYNEWVNPY